MKMQINDQILNSLFELQLKHPNLYIGGSVSLILQKAIPFREANDIDLIVPYKIHIYDIFNVDREKHYIIRKYNCDGIRNELFINPNAKFIEYNYQGITLKLSPIDETIEWKKKFLNRFKKEKHIKDLEFYDKVK